ncbi:MAG: YitT family protein, partial [Butyricicoccus sp.]
MTRKKERGKALAEACFGFVLIGIGCSMCIYSNLGSDTFNVLAQGTAGVLGVQVGTANYLIEVVMLLGLLLYRRSAVGLGTVIGSFLVGWVINLFAMAFAPALQAAGFVVRLCFAFAAPAVIGLGVALVQDSDWGLMPNELVVWLLYERIGRLQYRTVRIGYDLVMLAAG